MTITPVFGSLLAEGKTKQIYTCPDIAYMVSKDHITAGDGVRQSDLVGKSRWSTITTANIFRLLNTANIPTHFVQQINDVTVLVRRCTMLPVEQVQRRIATGSYLKRHPEVPEGTRFEPMLVETFLKDDARHDPQIWEEDIIKMGLVSAQEVAWMAEQGRRVFETLERAWGTMNVTLVDLKIEFGRDPNGELLVADVIDNDSWRLWPGGDKTRMLDKQVYRNLKEVTQQDLQGIAERYALVADLSGQLRLDTQPSSQHSGDFACDEQEMMNPHDAEHGVLVSHEGIGIHARGVPKVLVTMGSDSDLPLMMKAIDTLRFEFGIPCLVQINSVHRDLHATVKHMDTLPESICVVIACAGGAAHLPGNIADLRPDLPVIGVPRDLGALKGIDALLSMVQMPEGAPVAVMAIGEAGAINAAIHAAKELAVANIELRARLQTYAEKRKGKVRTQNQTLEMSLEDIFGAVKLKKPEKDIVEIIQEAKDEKAEKFMEEYNKQ